MIYPGPVQSAERRLATLDFTPMLHLLMENNVIKWVNCYDFVQLRESVVLRVSSTLKSRDRLDLDWANLWVIELSESANENEGLLIWLAIFSLTQLPRIWCSLIGPLTFASFNSSLVFLHIIKSLSHQPGTLYHTRIDENAHSDLDCELCSMGCDSGWSTCV